MLLHDILSALETITPLRYAEAWDNVGLLTGDPEAQVDRVLLTIDLTHAVLAEAAARRAELVVAYHPALFEAIKRVRHDSVLHRAIRADIAVWSPHTALDVAPGGTNDLLADILGMEPRAPLRVTSKLDGAGIRRIGALAEAPTRAALIDRIKRELGVEAVLVAGPLEGTVSRGGVRGRRARPARRRHRRKGRSLPDRRAAPPRRAQGRGGRPHRGVRPPLNSERAALRRLEAQIEAAAPRSRSRSARPIAIPSPCAEPPLSSPHEHERNPRWNDRAYGRAAGHRR